jgi:hypothetical protein
MLVTMLAVSMLATTTQLYAQATLWKETFQQKKTQKEYLLVQIANLQVYIGYVKKGYNIVNRGLTTIENIKNGDLNLHRDFFSSLKNVNPQITNSVKVADIIAFQVFLAKEMKKTYEFCRDNSDFTVQEIHHVYEVYHNMILLTDANLSDLMRILNKKQSRTPIETEMQDGERIKSIDKLYEECYDQLAFVRSFGQDARLVGALRQHERHQINVVGKQYEPI